MATSILKPLRVRNQKPEFTGSRCCVVNCSNRRGTDKAAGEKRHYHTFPSDSKRRQQWIKAIPRAGWVPSKSDVVCGDHFVGGKATHTEGSLGFVPSLFPTDAAHTARQSSTSVRAGTTNSNTTEGLPKNRKRKSHPPAAVWVSDHNYVRSELCKRPAAPPSQANVMSTQTVLPIECEVMNKSDSVPARNSSIQDPRTIMEPEQDVAQLRQRILELEAKNKLLLDKQLSLDLIRKSDKDCMFYTGIPNYATFKALFDYLYERSQGELRYWRGADTAVHEHFSVGYSSKPGPKRKFAFEEEFFITLVRLKTGRFLTDLGRELNASTSLLSRIVTTWTTFLAVELKELFEMQTNLQDEDMIAPCYHSYSSLRIVLDCTELTAERASNLHARKLTYSNYKNRDTIKFMVGLSPNLTVNYVSSGYGGRASDKHITLDSDSLLSNLPGGSQVMADRGFLVTDELKRMGVELIIPNFKGRNRSQMTQTEVINSEEISKARIHIERVIQRIRNFHILDSTIKLSQKDVIEQTFTVCAYLVNFQTPIKRFTPIVPNTQPTGKGPLDYLEPV